VSLAGRENIVLNLDHPQSAHIFAAARQIDLIVDYAKRISLEDADGRQFMNKVVAPCFAALHWLNENHFENDQGIHQRIADLQSALSKLSSVSAAHSDSPSDRKTCPVCKQALKKPSQYDPTPYCPGCLAAIMQPLSRLQSSEAGFGTDAI
jgi:hypothetical protein